MIELVSLDNVALRSEGTTLTMSLSAGSVTGVFGSAGAGASEFLSVVAGLVKPHRGTVHVRCAVSRTDEVRPLRRQKPLNLARSDRSAEANSIATEALLATRLWDERARPVGSLTPSQQAACELLPPLTSGAPLLLIDRHLDALDPWTLRSVLNHLRKLRTRGTSTIIATNRTDLLKHLDQFVVLENRIVRFAGAAEELLRLKGSHEFRVTAHDQPGALALVAPFAISVEERQQELRFYAAEGQEIAAKLLLEGYGNVSLVITRPPSLEEALLSLLR